MIGQMLSIHTVFGQLAVHSIYPSVEIRNDYPKVEIEREKGGWEYSSRSVELRLDSSACRAELGITSAAQSVRDQADAGKQAVLEAIGEAAQEGDFLMSSKDGAQALASLARQRMGKIQIKAFQGKNYSPYVLPEISWVPNSLTLQYTPDQLHFSASYAQPQIDCRPGSVEVTLAQEPSVDITYTGGALTGAGGLDVRA